MHDDEQIFLKLRDFVLCSFVVHVMSPLDFPTYIYCDVYGSVQYESDHDEITIIRLIHLSTQILINLNHRLLERDIEITGQTSILYTCTYDGGSWSQSCSYGDTRDKMQVLIGE